MIASVNPATGEELARFTPHTATAIEARFSDTDGAVAPGITRWIRPRVPHCFRNPDGEEPLLIFWTYASINATRTIVATDNTTWNDEEH